MPVSLPWFIAGLLFSLLVQAFIGTLAACVVPAARPLAGRIARILAIALAIAGIPLLVAQALEVWSAFFSDSVYERSQFRYRLSGPHAWIFWLDTIAALLPQALWLPAIRRRLGAMAVIAVLLAAHQAWLAWQSHVHQRASAVPEVPAGSAAAPQ